MSSRVDKYYDNNLSSVPSRTQRNNELYKEISSKEIGDYEIKSNATVIGNNSNNIDVEKIKSILDTHYNDTPRRKTIPIEKEEIPVKKEYETKEYDINVILNKAKEDKEETYDEIRNQKLHNTQYNILNDLNINKKDFIEDYEEEDNSKSINPSTASKLEELINTINLNEKDLKKAKESNEESTDHLDIFSELKGDDDTAILDGLQEKTEKLMEKLEKTANLDNTFFTKSNSIKPSDIENDDFSDIDEGPGTFVKILIVLMIIAFIVGIVFLVKILL